MHSPPHTPELCVESEGGEEVRGWGWGSWSEGKMLIKTKGGRPDYSAWKPGVSSASSTLPLATTMPYGPDTNGPPPSQTDSLCPSFRFQKHWASRSLMCGLRSPHVVSKAQLSLCPDPRGSFHHLSIYAPRPPCQFMLKS